ncbi:MAG: YitT family protein [Clostridia bacterium]|nr:YitT family protein [Clostridia bacterium]
MKKNDDKIGMTTAISDKRKKRLDTVKYWVILNLGVFMLAAGVFFFKGPNNFATGGVSGIAIIISRYVTGSIHFLTQSVLNLIMNVLLLIIGFIFLGRGCTFKTAYCSLVYTLEMYAMEWIFKAFGIELGNGVTITGLSGNPQPFLEFIYAMLLTGVGSAIMFNCRASSGGTDIVALIIKKYAKMDIGKALVVTDLLIASSTFFIFDTTTGLFSILGLFFKSFLVDGVIESIGKNKYVTIITANAELVAPFIIEGMKRSYTSFKAVGGYSGEEKTVMLTVCNRRQAYKLKMKIRQVDPAAFVILTDTSQIIGKGFQSDI